MDNSTPPQSPPVTDSELSKPAQVISQTPPQIVNQNFSSTPPPEPEFIPRLGSAWQRYLALSIDQAIIGIPVGIVLLIWLTQITIPSDANNLQLITQQLSPFQYISAGISILYFIYFTTKNNTTPGKNVYGLNVVAAGTTTPVSSKRIIVRESTKVVLSSLPFIGSLLFLISGIMIVFDKQKRGIHDHVAATQVVQVKKSWSIKKQLLYGGIYMIVLLLFLVAIFLIFASKLPPGILPITQ